MKRLILVVLAASLIAGCQKREAPAPVATALPESTPTPNPAPAPPASPSTVTLPADAPIPSTGVALWLVASDAVGGAVDGKIDSWTNPLVLGVTAKAMSSQARPSIVANAMNSHAVLRFDGEDDMLMTNIDISPEQMPEATVVAVFSSITAESSPLRKLYGDDNGGYDRAVGLDDRAGEGKNYGLFTGLGVTGYFALEADKPYITIDQYSEKEFSGWVNSVTALSKIPANWGDALPNLYLGGTGTVYNEFWKGDLAEIIVYARMLSEEERQQTEDYLAEKYGLILARTPADSTATPLRVTP